MVFSYYNRLTQAQKRIYRQSDQITSIRLPPDHGASAWMASLAEALKTDDRMKTEGISHALLSSLTGILDVPPVRVKVLAARPSRHWGELHGLYQPAEGRGPAEIKVWMRTAQRRQVVAFKTFLRTLIHELCHHLDYELLELGETFHTQGFYQRESSIVHQLLRTATENRGDLDRR
jgi:hypothetical protein